MDFLLRGCSGAQWSEPKYKDIVSWVCGFCDFSFLALFLTLEVMKSWSEDRGVAPNPYSVIFFCDTPKDNLFHTMAVPSNHGCQASKNPLKKQHNSITKVSSSYSSVLYIPRSSVAKKIVLI